MNSKHSIIFLFVFFFVTFSYAQDDAVNRYISRYKKLAIKEMKRTGIPASITLAQGILESRSGLSRLATQGNNHFGIKCHNTWTGRTIYEDDDRRQECFRKYHSAKASFIDHSNFLTGKQRYAFLFKIPSDNYKAWAKGLKKAGYATAWNYHTRLINLIERYKLYRYDTGKYHDTTPENEIVPGYNYRNSASIKQRIRYRNRVPYFLITEGDSWQRIEQELGISRREIMRYNDFTHLMDFKVGTPIYLKKKKRRTPRKYQIHTANGHESMHDISQRYAIRLAILLKNNGIKSNETPYKGQQVLLR